MSASPHCRQIAGPGTIGALPPGVGVGTFQGADMAKRSTIESDKQPSGKEIRTPDKQTIKNFNSTFDGVKTTVDEANKELQDSAKNAKSKHLNISAFKVAKGLFDGFRNAKNPSIASEKLAAWLANFDALREYFELDKHANLQGRFLKPGTIGGAEPVTAVPDVNGVPRGTDEDGELDPRPSHLRQPGASATSAVDKIKEDALSKVGRGPQPKPN